MDANVPIKEVTIEAVVIRADGQREDLGVISRSTQGPFKRLFRKLKEKR